MSLSGFVRKIKALEVLSSEQVEEIHKSILDTLENTGVRFEYDKALKIFKKNECNVNFDTKIVKFPSGIVEELLRKVPSSFTVKSRDPKNNIRIGGNTLFFAPMPGMHTIDLATWKSRPATLEENKQALIVMDALENLHILSSYTPYFEIEGVPPAMAIPKSFAEKIKYSSKVSWEGYQNNCEIFVIEMSKVVNQDTIGICLPSAPLAYYSDACESGIRFAEACLPVNIANAPVMGGTSPVTIAGSLVTFFAEAIAGILLLQLVKPGTSIMLEGALLQMNMKTGAPIFNSVSNCLFMVAFIQLCRKYGIPSVSDTGWTNSKKIDFQNGYERTINTIIMAQAGCNIIILHGGIYAELVHHPIQSILDDDIAGMVGKFIQGFDVTTDKLAVDLINNVGPIPGHFLNTSHTRQYYKEEGFLPKCSDFLTYPEWEKNGFRDSIDLAKERLEKILSGHQPVTLTDDQDNEIEKILKKARSYYEDNGLL